MEYRYYGAVGYNELNGFLAPTINVYDEEGKIFKSVDVSSVHWIDLIRLNKFFSHEYCSATNWNSCKNCSLYPVYCGKAILYLRTFVSPNKSIRFKIGVSYDILRPLVQSSPFAVIAKDLNRRYALLLEKKIAKLSKKIVQSPVGRMVWAEVIKFGYWNGEKESEEILEFLETLYRRAYIYFKKEEFALLTNPILYIAGPNFSTDLPPWIDRLNLFEIKKILKKDPKRIAGEVISNRAFLFLVEEGENAYFFEPKERSLYLIMKIVGEESKSKVFKKVVLDLKDSFK